MHACVQLLAALSQGVMELSHSRLPVVMCIRAWKQLAGWRDASSDSQARGDVLAAQRAEDLVLTEFAFCVIDEVDSILIDEARTPLIISGPAEKSSEKYYQVRAALTFFPCYHTASLWIFVGSRSASQGCWSAASCPEHYATLSCLKTACFCLVRLLHLALANIAASYSGYGHSHWSGGMPL